MAKFRNKLDPVHLYAPAGEPTSLFVDTGQVVEVPGEAKEIDDAHVVGEEDAALAFPTSRWELVVPKKSERE